MAVDINTYGSGARLRPTRDLTQRDLILMTDRLSEVFGSGWKFEPEAITEGGIIISQWPFKTPAMYKTFRFSAYSDSVLWKEWPWVQIDYRTEWLASNTVIFNRDPIYPKPRVYRQWIGTCLKAFDGAPAWTREELIKVENVFLEFGLLVYHRGSCVKV